MIGAISGGESLGSAISIYFAQQEQSVNGPTALSGSIGGEGASGVAQGSATISRPGQLLSNLQQLQTQDPTKFQQVVSQIASQLQRAVGAVCGVLHPGLPISGGSMHLPAQGRVLPQPSTLP